MQTFVNKIFTVALLIIATSIAQAAPWGTIHGHKFNDLNGNGIDNSEPRIGGITIVVQNIGGGIPVQVAENTDGLGRYVFTNLPFQKYIVCEVLAVNSPWVPTTPQCVEVELTSKDSSDMVIFGNKRKPDNDIGCTRTQGFWGSSPAGELLLKFLVPGTMPLGNTNYTAAQLNSIFDKAVGGNALLILAHQLIAAKANVLAGANSAPIAATIVNADNAIAALIIPPIGASFVSPPSALGMIMTNLAADLDKYNNGLAGVPHCD